MLHGDKSMKCISILLFSDPQAFLDLRDRAEAQKPDRPILCFFVLSNFLRSRVAFKHILVMQV
jgi:hypothetical protein